MLQLSDLREKERESMHITKKRCTTSYTASCPSPQILTSLFLDIWTSRDAQACAWTMLYT